MKTKVIVLMTALCTPISCMGEKGVENFEGELVFKVSLEQDEVLLRDYDLKLIAKNNFVKLIEPFEAIGLPGKKLVKIVDFDRSLIVGFIENGIEPLFVEKIPSSSSGIDALRMKYRDSEGGSRIIETTIEDTKIEASTEATEDSNWNLIWECLLGYLGIGEEAPDIKYLRPNELSLYDTKAKIRSTFVLSKIEGRRVSLVEFDIPTPSQDELIEKRKLEELLSP